MSTSIPLAFLMGKTPLGLFEAGGVIMWPMLFLSLVAMTVVLERLVFAFREKRRRQPQVVAEMMRLIEQKRFEEAANLGADSKDYLARILHETVQCRGPAMPEAFSRAASQELARFNQGLIVLDTAITAAPLLGLLGTVTGMMGSFGEISGDLGAPTAITGGIAEALVATACGLLIAVTALLPYNYLNSQIEDARREIEETGIGLEIALGTAFSAAPANTRPVASPSHA